MEALRDIGAIGKQTMRQFDEACLTPIRDLTPAEIKALRNRERISQPVFARYLNVSKNLVSDWERGVKKPGGPGVAPVNRDREKGARGYCLIWARALVAPPPFKSARWAR